MALPRWRGALGPVLFGGLGTDEGGTLFTGGAVVGSGLGAGEAVATITSLEGAGTVCKRIMPIIKPKPTIKTRLA